MSHNVTVTRTITTSSTSAVLINTGYMKTWPGIFKLVQVILGIVNVGLVGYYYNNYYSYSFITTGITFFLLMAVAFLITSFLLLLSCLVSISTASIIAKTIFEFLYHGAAFIFYLAASLTLIIEINNRGKTRYYEELFAAGVIGLVVSGLYLLSAIFGYRSYKGF